MPGGFELGESIPPHTAHVSMPASITHIATLSVTDTTGCLGCERLTTNMEGQRWI
jgi:hypothetical protein